VTVSRPVESLRESWFFDLVRLGSLKPSPDVERTEQPYIPNMPIPVIHVLATLARERQDFFSTLYFFVYTPHSDTPSTTLHISVPTTYRPRITRQHILDLLIW